MQLRARTWHERPWHSGTYVGCQSFDARYIDDRMCSRVDGRPIFQTESEDKLKATRESQLFKLTFS